MMDKMRGPRPLRSLRQAIEDRKTEASRTEHLEDVPTEEMLEQYLDQIGNESLQASKTARLQFLYYRQKRTGRRCSCFSVETSPDAFCQICYGSGFVGGWDLHGCRSEWIDITYPNLSMSNVVGNFDAGIRPAGFVLEPGCRFGFVEVEVPLVRNIQKTQQIQSGVGALRFGTSVNLFIRAPSESNYTALTDASLAARLSNQSIYFRAEIFRSNTALPSPIFSHAMLRYMLIPEVYMFGDINLAEQSFELGDLGHYDTFTTLNLYVPNAFDKLEVGDFLIRHTDQKRFKVTRKERNVVLSKLLSHTIGARLLLPGTDSLIRYP